MEQIDERLTGDANVDETHQREEGVEDELEEVQPFNPDKISIDKKPITMDTCLRRLEQGTIVLAPDFQRNEVWTSEKKCRLIESLMLKIPIPMFYVSSSEEGTFSVVDGLQRLSTIRSFILGDEYLKTRDPRLKGHGFRLSKLEFWEDKYNNNTFNDLPINIQNRLLETEFTFTIINPGTPEEVKRNVFKRINTGGEPLTAQEIRHALYIGKSTELIKELSEEQSFLSATTGSVKSNRMMDRELILRFAAFNIRHHSHYYKNGDMDSFLSDTMRLINGMPTLEAKDLKKLLPDEDARKQILITDVQELRKRFVLSMSRAQELFGVYAFRKSYSGRRRLQINKALFEMWSVLLGQLSETGYSILKSKKASFLLEYNSLLDTLNFQNAISRDSLKYTSMQFRYQKLEELLTKFSNA